MNGYIDIAFLGPPTKRVVETEDYQGKNVHVGEWVNLGDVWALRIPKPATRIHKMDVAVKMLEKIKGCTSIGEVEPTTGLTYGQLLDMALSHLQNARN